MLFPKKVKHRKWQTGRKSEAKRNTPDTRGITVSFGSFGLKATSQSRVRSNQIEAARRVISRTLGKTGKIWIRIFPDQPITKKAAEDLDHYVFEVKPGRILFEVEGVPEDLAKEAFRKACAKLPLQGKLVRREETRA